jgi:ribosomal protein S18 acetylase RimI-like enzyme
MGPFFGILENDEIISIAGVHIVSRWASVGAIGNVYTRPDRRGRGLATRTTAAVVQTMLEEGIETIVLNVAMDNKPALRCYRNLSSIAAIAKGVGSLIFARRIRKDNRVSATKEVTHGIYQSRAHGFESEQAMSWDDELRTRNK